MRDIDDARDAEDQRQPGGDEEQPGRRREPVERLKQEGIEGHAALYRELSFAAPIAESPARECEPG